MPLLGFRARFGPAILDGSKRQTIRAPRKDQRPHASEGSTLYLYTGLRTKNACKLGEARCLGVDEVRLNLARDTASVISALGVRPIVGPADLDAFAQRDGLADWADMKATFAELHGDQPEFNGVIIRWGDLL